MPKSPKQQAIEAIHDRMRRFEPEPTGPNWLAQYKEQIHQAELFYLSMQKRGWKIVPK